MVDKLSPRAIVFFFDVDVVLGKQRRPRQPWNGYADGVTIAADRAFERWNDAAQLDAIGFVESLLQQRRRHFESNKVMIGLRGIALLRNLRDIESELGADMIARI